MSHLERALDVQPTAQACAVQHANTYVIMSL